VISADQANAFRANAGFAPTDVSTVILGIVFAVLLVWGVWAMRSAYAGWSDRQLDGAQLLAVILRFAAMYLILGYFLLS
jgi:integrating conjugative element protein (TIGR03758 family)